MKDEIPEVMLMDPPARAPSAASEMSTESPVALRDDSGLPPAPVGLPLIVPVHVPTKRHGPPGP